jgi:ZIP family zinc transporter
MAMAPLTEILIYTLFAGACIPLGGVLAIGEKIRPAWLENDLRHGIIAFGGGILLAAVALVLVPEGTHYLAQSPFGLSAMAVAVLSTVMFVVGGISFFALEKRLGLKRREKPQFTAMLLDYIPESLALGGAFALGSKSAVLLAIFIGLQNIPEGFNAYRELHSQNKQQKWQIILLMLLLVPIGPIIALLGWFYLANHVALLGFVMLFASGGILYLIFQDIAPQAHIKRHWAPPLGAVLGFSLGMLANNLVASL